MILTSENDLKKIVADVISELQKLEPSEQKKEEKLFTSNEACEILRCSKPTLHRWKREGLIDHVRIGRNIRYRESDIEKIMNRK